MQIEQHFELPVSPSAAWPAFADVPLLVSCLPGAALTGAPVDGAWPLRFDVKMGPMTAGFVGSGQASHDDAAHSGKFDGAATDKRSQSRVKGAATFSLTPADAAGTGGGTRVTVVVDYTLTGPLAQFSRGGLVRELASALTAQFAANLAARLQVAAPALATSAPQATSAPPATSAAQTAPDPMPAAPASLPMQARPPPAALNANALLWQVLRGRWHRLLAWLSGRQAG
jgi:carbon monoxide dehydrogenase subunit G